MTTLVSDREVFNERIAANQATVRLQEAWLLGEHKRVATQLEQTVALRTRDVATSNEELRQTIDAIPHAIAVLHPDGRTLEANALLLNYTGLRLDEARA